MLRELLLFIKYPYTAALLILVLVFRTTVLFRGGVMVS